MRLARKKPQLVQAWCLGADSEMERTLLKEGKLRRTPEGDYEVFSQESTGGHGELAHPGDWFKVDASGAPYPNQKAWFEAHHRPVSGDTFEQFGEVRPVWFAGEEMDETLRWLMDTGRLRLNEDAPAHYFSATLWDAPLTAPRDAALVIYSVERDDGGAIADINFNFVARAEFDATYELL